ncbi:potassium-transporting ATPase subunit F [Cellulomonas sp. HD19AZ1]|nr:potassium-transporting ATPase subunit F [Cellulomonas sp. HD19AZ1]
MTTRSTRGRPRPARPHRRPVRAARRARARARAPGGPAVSGETVAALVVAVGLAAYLLRALLHPERR